VQRGVCPADFDHAVLPVGHVKEQGRPDNPPPENVKAAAIERFAMVLCEFNLAERGVFPHPGRLIDLHRRTSHFLDEQTADRERLIAQHPTREACPRAACEEGILGIAFRHARRDF
jgi:hypothetical protein